MAKGFQKGVSGNPAGRPVGSKNRTTAEIRQMLHTLYSANLDRFQNDIDSMQPYPRQLILNAILKKNLPDLNKNENENNNSGAIEILVRYEDKPDAE